jgi:hypothetical protein
MECPGQYSLLIIDRVHGVQARECLVEGVGASSPPGQEQAETDGLEYPGYSTHGNGIKRSLLGEDLADELLIASKPVSKKDLV